MAKIVIAIASLLLFSTMANAIDTIEVRGPVAEVIDGAEYVWGPQDFAGFYYDADDNIGTETISLTIIDGALDEPCGIKYETIAQEGDFEFEDWGSFNTIGFLGEEYFVAYVDDGYLFDDSEDTNLMVDEQISKVLYNDDEEYTFTTGTPLKLKEGYELAIQAIDLDGGRVYLELNKDGNTVDSAIVEPSMYLATIEDKTYTYTVDLGDTEDIVVIAVHFKNAFRGAEQDLATVDGIWQISDEITDVEEDTEYDKMTIQTVDSDALYIMMDNEDNKITLNRNKDTSLMGNIRIKTADQDVISATEPLRFYLYREIAEPGTYEVRGSVAGVVYGAAVEWDTSNFAGFYYDIDDNIGTEWIVMTITGDALDEPCGVMYETSAQEDDFAYEDWGTFYNIPFMGDLYFAGYTYDTCTEIFDEAGTANLLVSEQLSKILVNDGISRVVASDEIVELKEGYALKFKIGTDEKGILVELLHEGEVIDRVALSPPVTYVYTVDQDGAPKVPTIAAHFQEPISIGGKSYCKVDGLWQISDTPIMVEEDTEYDKMTVQIVDSDGLYIMMDNEDNKITLAKNKDISLMGDIRIKTADQDCITAEEPLRWYIYEEVTIDGEEEAI